MQFPAFSVLVIAISLAASSVAAGTFVPKQMAAEASTSPTSFISPSGVLAISRGGAIEATDAAKVLGEVLIAAGLGVVLAPKPNAASDGDSNVSPKSLEFLRRIGAVVAGAGLAATAALFRDLDISDIRALSLIPLILTVGSAVLNDTAKETKMMKGPDCLVWLLFTSTMISNFMGLDVGSGLFKASSVLIAFSGYTALLVPNLALKMYLSDEVPMTGAEKAFFTYVGSAFAAWGTFFAHLAW
ncbi:expressed unknown protein [Seminavis robusta]|uniref:Uncharacterized protein n=1 Tax=Seminavis robusta TaxID=568900 RepID=A0A9N8HL99_9STRA|nr:expressed unknown protein [Seminavis robusta]|eukprot:Sro794_g203390.1 n/a (243) ;mRNA; f:18760-19488